MRAANVVLGLLLAASASGCTDACDLDGKVVTDHLSEAAPGAVMTVALSGCSTCGHTVLQAFWGPRGIDGGTAGFIEIQLSPQCFVRDTTLEAIPDDIQGKVDTNVKNCGDVVDYAAYVTNRTNVTLEYLDIDLQCPTAN